ncbi:hypothetical protein NVV95_04190 [Herbiconiux sp. CPCC 205716]|uniref:Uncharacterized protein n=1 Tax=Herbiconiux gentiana TaxID=2970912 RepID=A0ABT2GC30_9MICO|nr:hypothetical protein [Herbiconiux gentiana]MCS5713750.1 hypothetical protein [Herbiconiux gentiana]
MTPSSPGDPHDRHPHDQAVSETASWVSAAVARSRDSAPPLPLPGIVAPLEFALDFAANSQSDAVSVSLANGTVGVAPWAADASGVLTISVRWSEGFSLAGLETGSEIDGWTVAAVAAGRADLEHPSIGRGVPAVPVPALTLVKAGAPDDGDEVTARVSGTSGYCRDCTVRGWSRS